MSLAAHASYAIPQIGDSSILKQQLVREISCLERQLERVKIRDEFSDDSTLQTYEEMIVSRRKMLHNLPWEG
jgi:hypothetical protein